MMVGISLSFQKHLILQANIFNHIDTIGITMYYVMINAEIIVMCKVQGLLIQQASGITTVL